MQQHILDVSSDPASRTCSDPAFEAWRLALCKRAANGESAHDRLQRDSVHQRALLSMLAVRFLDGALQLDPRDRSSAATLRTHPYIASVASTNPHEPRSTAGGVRCAGAGQVAGVGSAEAVPSARSGPSAGVNRPCMCKGYCCNSMRQHPSGRAIGRRLDKCTAQAMEGSNYCKDCLCSHCRQRVARRGEFCWGCSRGSDMPPAGSIWHLVNKFEASLARMKLLDLDVFLGHAKHGNTCSTAVAALLWEPSGVAAFYRRLQADCPEDRCPTPRELRRAILAAADVVDVAQGDGPLPPAGLRQPCG